jgi:putative tricarboxylic transport membrane protein
LRRDHVLAALGIVLAAAFWFAADAVPTSMLSDNVGAGGVPKGIAGFLAVLSLAVAFSKPKAFSSANHVKALGIAALGFLYVMAAPFIGYLVSITALAGGAALYYGAPRRPGVALFAVGSALVLWLLFGRLLGIALP